ncbi:PREDICTED: myb-like protein X [Eufriesea mexicana]|uniref:myb-like protein X n=1 Tax=Eufriesea mexicana TaxID=516756 RepID=UPI00083BB565|nr:PREDICTED: myb-like protein X [Eufriesea mexicana]XP_017761076.1 PREDICTED: myb-like protein X [Eufriesea mexicana]
MESSGGDKQNESDECDVTANNRHQNKMTGQEDSNVLKISKDLGDQEALKNLKNLENISQNDEASTKLSKAVSQENEDDEDECKGSDEDELKEEKTDGKKDEESSSSTTSTSTSDDESETSSDDKTEASKTEQTKTVTSETKKEDQASKNDDTTDDSDIEDDLISAINYNTITSLAALKDMLQSSGEDSDGVDSFFHHYFLSHVNRLPSRNQTHSPYPWGRRLSECREEDEYENEDAKNVEIPIAKVISESKKDVAKIEEPEEKNESVSSKASSPCISEKSSSEKIDQKSNPEPSVSEPKPQTTAPTVTTTTVSTTTSVATSTTTTTTTTTTSSRFTTSTVTSPTSTTKPPLRRRHTTGPGMTFPATDPPTYSTSMTFSRTSPLPSPHLDKRFFDSSLIEMKSQASSSSTLDYDSTEEVWVRRVDFVQERKRKVSGIASPRLLRVLGISVASFLETNFDWRSNATCAGRVCIRLLRY